MYKADVIADSTNKYGNRLTTFKVTYPRIVHAEMCRHRMLSRNTASSRAIPFKKMVKDVEENPFIPIAWQKDHKGMQGSEYIEKGTVAELAANRAWLRARNNAIKEATELNDEKMANVTKQLCNRLLEPFVWVTEIISGTEWENFFSLRCPAYTINRIQPENDIVTYRSWKDLYKDYPEMSNCTLLEKLECNKSQADIHIQAIAELMWDAMNESTPKQLQAGEWHIPFGDNFDDGELHKIFNNKYTVTQKNIDELKIKIATARCARISYETLGDNPKVDYEADIKLHDRLADMKHWSPFEHISRAMSEDEMDENLVVENGKVTLGKSRNFTGFIQYRTLIENGL